VGPLSLPVYRVAKGDICVPNNIRNELQYALQTVDNLLVCMPEGGNVPCCRVLSCLTVKLLDLIICIPIYGVINHHRKVVSMNNLGGPL
jgi:hypothetical protein